MSSKRQVLSVLTSAVGLALLVTHGACSSEEILLVTLPDAGTPDGVPIGPSCDDDRECEGDAFCARPTCDAKRGVCERRPTFCEGSPAPVCGCDGLTYWNDCLRRARGQRAAISGECVVGRGTVCGGPTGRGCPPGSMCARIAPPSPGGPSCAPDLPGVCWVPPAACPPTSGVDRFVKCGPPGPSPPCVDLCEAIRSGRPHERALSCP
jgi:hypothetical protein